MFISGLLLAQWTEDEKYALEKNTAGLACPLAKITEIKAKAAKGADTVKIDCNLSLSAADTITKRLIFVGASASGVTVNCNGATINGGPGTYNYNMKQAYMIEVKSRQYWDVSAEEWKWERPRDIVLKGCKIIGPVRVWGMSKTGEGNEDDDNNNDCVVKKPNYLLESSRKTGHTGRARMNAPTNIVFDNVRITSYRTSPLYFAPGVTHCTLINSEINGEAEGVAIYFDAESYSNTIKNNYIHVGHPSVRKREQIAIDGSSYNRIINNRFSALNNGGIFLYRNCGEGEVIRHATPSYNQIINNVFYYDAYTGDTPSVFLASRSGNRSYCDCDKGYPFGSSISDSDYARYNVVMQNQIYKLPLKHMIRTKDTLTNRPNYISNNTTVTTETKRLAGCYVQYGYPSNFILHGQSINVFKNSSGEPVCTGYKYVCNDGELIRSSDNDCVITKTNFSCQVTGNNNGCQKTVYCGTGQKIIAAKAAANLEFGTISDEQLIAVPPNRMRVVKTSDTFGEGICYIGNNSLSTGEKTISGINGLTKVLAGCKEHDTNGGDCHIRGAIYCYGTAPVIPITRK